MSERDVLSDQEREALMETAADAAVEACQPFDFSARDQSLLAQMPGLGRLAEKQALALAQELQNIYRLGAHIESEELQLVNLDEALNGIDDPAGINSLGLSPLPGVSYLVVPAPLLSFFVQAYFGGPATAVETSQTRLSPTELRVNDVVRECFVRSLIPAWQDKANLTAQPGSVDTNAEFLQAASPDEMAVLFSFTVTVGDWQAALQWIVPYAMLEPLRARLGSGGAEQVVAVNSGWQQHFQHELQGVELELVGAFTSREVSLRDVLNFKAGSIVPIKMPSEVAVTVEGKIFATGEHGVSGGNKSIMIKQMLRQGAASN